MEPSDVQGGHATAEGRQCKRLDPQWSGSSSYGEETRSVFGVKGTCWNLWGEEFFKVNGDIAMDALMCVEEDFVFNPGGDGEPV